MSQLMSIDPVAVLLRYAKTRTWLKTIMRGCDFGCSPGTKKTLSRFPKRLTA
jgi:hypothetical protein